MADWVATMVGRTADNSVEWKAASSAEKSADSAVTMAGRTAVNSVGLKVENSAASTD